MYKEKVYDAITGEEYWRDFTPEEIAITKKADEENKARLKALDEAKTKRLAAIEKLKLLGLDEQDLIALGF